MQDDLIRETFYNVLYEQVLKSDVVPQHRLDGAPGGIARDARTLVTTTLDVISKQHTDSGFPTIRDTRVDGTSSGFAQLFQLPLQIAVDNILKLDSFKERWTLMMRFHAEAHRECKVDAESINETFFAQISDDLFTQSNVISHDAIRDRDAFVYIGITAQSVINVCLSNLDTDGISLNNKLIVTNENCVPTHRALFAQWINLKRQFRVANPTPQQLDIIRKCVSGDPDVDVGQNLLKTPELMRLAASASGLAIQISQMPTFKTRIETVLSIFDP
jgi:hypothetical protein